MVIQNSFVNGYIGFGCIVMGKAFGVSAMGFDPRPTVH